MPTIYTGSYKIPFESGKGLGAIQAEKESYTRGVEQARLDMQKKKIADDQMMRKLARIDAEEKETRRQLEWESIAKRSREAVEENKRRWELEQERKGEMTDYQKQIIEAKKRAEQDNLELLKQVQAGQQTTQPTVTQPATQAPQQQGIMGLLAQKQDEWKGVPYKMPEAPSPTPATKQAYTPPADIADLSTGDRDVLESIHKQLKPLNEAKLRQEANIEAYGKYGAGTKANIAAISIFNNKIKQIESDNKKVKSELIKTQNEVRENKRKAGKEGKLTPVQQFSQASKIVESASYGETIYTARQIKWAKDIVAKYTGGAATQEKVTQEKWWNK